MDSGQGAGQLGVDVRRRRRSRGWTLAEAAPRLGVSRRLLAQIEAGEANPSLSTLLSLAAGFDTSLTELLAEADKPSIVRSDVSSASVLWRGEHGGEGRLLGGSDQLELWQWSLAPGEERRSEAHRPGSREILLVTTGLVRLAVGTEEPVLLKVGHSAVFRADEPHSYANTSRKRAEFILAVHEPSGAPS